MPTDKPTEGGYDLVLYHPRDTESGKLHRVTNCPIKCRGSCKWRKRRWPYRAGWHNVCIDCGAFSR